MREREPMTQSMNLSRAREQFSQVVNKVFKKETRVLVEKSGIPVAAIVSADDLHELQRMDQQRKQAFSVIDEIRTAFADVPESELDGQIDQALTQVRIERRAEKEGPRPHG